MDIQRRSLPDAVRYILVQAAEGSTNLHPAVMAELLLATLRGRLEQLPEDAATSSRDYGRGYAAAVKDVMALLQ